MDSIESVNLRTSSPSTFSTLSTDSSFSVCDASEISVNSDETARIDDSFLNDENTSVFINKNCTCPFQQLEKGFTKLIHCRKTDNSLVVWEFKFKSIYYFAVITAVLAIITAFVLGFTFDYSINVGYHWSCGKVYLPSFSRVINLPLERTVWNFLILVHIGIRPFLVWINCRKSYVRTKSRLGDFLNVLLCLSIAVSGINELIFLGALTVVGEREQADFHVLFFIGFAVSSFIYFALTSTATLMSKKVTKCSSILKLILFVAYFLLLPTLTTSFILYYKFCYQYSYELFTIAEYITIFINLLYHCTAILDCSDVYQIRVGHIVTNLKVVHQ